MTGYDLQKYRECVKLAKAFNMEINPIGDSIEIAELSLEQPVFGRFNKVDDVYHYLCGYEYGYSKGKLKLENENKNIFIDSRDGMTYKTHKFGSQVWMVDNFRHKGDGAYSYNNDEVLADVTYGRLYEWDAAMRYAPKGWHLPSDEEWNELIEFLGGEEIAGRKMQESKFNVLLSGYRYYDGSFLDMGSYAHFWSSSQYDASYAWYRSVHDGRTDVYRSNTNKTNGFCVRCIKD